MTEKVRESKFEQATRLGRRFRLRAVAPSLACAIAVFAAAPQGWAQPASGIDPVVIRLNGLDALTEDVIPFLVDQNNLGHFEQGPVTLLNTQPTLSFFGFSVSVFLRTSLTGVTIDVPVDSDSINAAFANATAPNGRVSATINVPDATLGTVLAVRAGLRIELPTFIPAEIRDAIRNLVTIADDFAIGVDGARLTMRVTLARQNGAIVITTVEQFTPQVNSVTVADSAGLVSIANTFSVTVNQLFGLPGSGTVNSAATTLTNNLIRNNTALRNMFRNSMNTALRRASRALGFSATLPDLDLIPLQTTISLASFSTQVNRLTTNFNVSVVSANGGVPAVPYTYLARAAENVNNIAAAGDMQAFLPLSLFDKATFELGRAGLLSIDIPVGTNLVMGIEVLGVARAVATPGFPQSVTLRIPIRLDNRGPVTGTTPDLIDVQARLDIRCSLSVDDRNGLTMRFDAITLANLSGSIRSGGTTAPVSGLRTLLQTSILNELVEHLPELTLVPKVTNIAAPFAVSIGTVSVGPRFARVPLTLVTE